MASIMTVVYLAAALSAVPQVKVERAPDAITLTQSTATFQFSGLVLFTTRDVSNPTQRVKMTQADVQQQLIAIIPNVKHGFISHTDDGQMSVEDHTAIIAFWSCDLKAVTGWEVKQLRPNLLYIELTGERLHFVADAPNNPAPFTWGLAKVGGAQLQPQFQTAPGAAAVFDIPYGTFSACLADTADQRVDSKLTLNNYGTITIAANGGKSLSLAGGAKAYIADMPMAWLINQTASADESSHYSVYCEMTGDTQCPPPAFSQGNGPSSACGDPTFIILAPSGGGNTSQHRGPHPTSQSADVFCSNTQWP